MNHIKLDISKVYGFVPEAEINKSESAANVALKKLYNKSGEGNDFLGWLDLPSKFPESLISDIEKTAAKLRSEIDLLVVVGIGGSYLGAKAIIDALSNNFAWMKTETAAPQIVFAGQNIGEDYISELLEVLDKKNYGIAVISKSGTTTEPALAFRILKNHLEKKVGKENAKKKIIAITDHSKGALRKMADIEGYKTFIIPDDTGGRFSVLTPVGLLPIAVAGFNIREFIKGAAEMEKSTSPEIPFSDNPASLYAATRNALYNKGKKIEILANFNSKLIYFSEWWKQLYGESEGKDGKGIYPASVNFTADLHSMGQYIQDGERHIFETVISVEKPASKFIIPKDNDDFDQLNYIAGKRVDEVNKMAELGTMLAHVDGGVPNIRISIDTISEFNLGQLVYFFEIACGISGYLLKVNPFNQPGVEAYKTNMFALLEKPGFEEETKKIKSRI
ncbi:MAG: glucose-6-phosphate isomerase [Bacteroidales bacterium]|nr:glucose-6-phosphate isomerase [Bacteroidales bacterium]